MTRDAQEVVDDDPGWGFSWQLVLMVIPFVGLVYRRRSERRASDGLVAIRQVFTSVSLSIVPFGIFFVVLYPSYKQLRHPPVGVAIGSLVAGALSALIGPRIERPLDCADDARLAASYRVRFFLRLAFSEVAALFGFVVFFLTYLWWTYPAGAFITAFGLRRAAPTAGKLHRDQEVLTLAGCPRSLVHALRTIRPPGRGTGGLHAN